MVKALFDWLRNLHTHKWQYLGLGKHLRLCMKCGKLQEQTYYWIFKYDRKWYTKNKTELKNLLKAHGLWWMYDGKELMASV